MSLQLRRSVEKFCQLIGQNRLLVQGAGGNISWKMGDSMFVKASGTWLADAVNKDIFVEVDYKNMLSSIEQNDFALTPKVICGSSLRPSIETILHGLLPHKIVLHIHAVEILAFLIQDSASDELARLIPANVKFAIVDYFKPGQDLAKATWDAISLNPNIQVVFLKNHGIVIGGNDIDEVGSLLAELCSYFTKDVLDFRITPGQKDLLEQKIPDGYRLAKYDNVHSLALDQKLVNRVKNDWRICPDHIVFLGAKAIFYDPLDSQSLIDNDAPFLFSEGLGVYESKDVTDAQRVQLLFFYDVLTRISGEAEIVKLNQLDVNELLDWDAEKYRLKINAV
jgi:rhamnose utilization protein RhaD (predicted bifunctional aldolase and dehydrogenase)